jgi:hypothetical protein
MFDDYKILLQPRYYALWQDYCHYLETGWRRFGGNLFDTPTKNEQLRLLETAVRKDFVLKNTLLSRLQKAFVVENLSLYLLLEPIQAWRYLSASKKADSESRIAEVVGKFTAPAARMLCVLNEETPSAYLPLTAMLSLDMFLNWNEWKSDLPKNFARSDKKQNEKLVGLWKNAFVLLEIVNSKRLKFKLAGLLRRQQLNIQRRFNNKQPQIDFLDRIDIFLYSLYWFIIIPKRTLKQKEM